MKSLFTVAVLISIAPAFFDDRVSYASSLLSLFLMFLLFGIAYSHGYFQADLSYMHTFLSRSEVSKVRFYGFFRLYDWPALIGLLIFLILVGRQNILGVFPALLGYISVVMASLSVVILLGKRLGSVETGKSLKAAFFRIFSLTVWVISIYGLYLVNQLVIFLLTFQNYKAYDFIFPISYGFWISQPTNIKYAALNLSYLVVFSVTFRFSLRELSREEVARHHGGLNKWKIGARGRTAALLVKDFKQLFRNPQLFVLALLPIFTSLMYLVFYRSYAKIASVLSLQVLLALTVSTLVSLDKSSYLFSLPLTEWEVNFSKILMGLLIYFISMGIVLAIVIHKDGNPLNLLSLLPTGIAVTLVAVQFSQKLTNEPVNVESMLATLISLFIVLVPAAIGGIAALILKTPFVVYSFPVSLIETLLVVLLFAVANRHKLGQPFRI